MCWAMVDEIIFVERRSAKIRDYPEHTIEFWRSCEYTYKMRILCRRLGFPHNVIRRRRK